MVANNLRDERCRSTTTALMLHMEPSRAATPPYKRHCQDTGLTRLRLPPFIVSSYNGVAPAPYNVPGLCSSDGSTSVFSEAGSASMRSPHYEGDLSGKNRPYKPRTFLHRPWTRCNRWRLFRR